MGSKTRVYLRWAVCNTIGKYGSLEPHCEILDPAAAWRIEEKQQREAEAAEAKDQAKNWFEHVVVNFDLFIKRFDGDGDWTGGEPEKASSWGGSVNGMGTLPLLNKSSTHCRTTRSFSSRPPKRWTTARRTGTGRDGYTAGGKVSEVFRLAKIESKILDTLRPRT